MTWPPTSSDYGTTQQLNATQLLDDGTLLTLSGGSESWSVTSGQLPAGLTLNPSTGVVSGTPTGSGAYSFTIQVTDGLGHSAQQTFSGTSPTPTIASTDTPTMPPLAVGLLAVLLFAMAGRYLAKPVMTLSRIILLCLTPASRKFA